MPNITQEPYFPVEKGLFVWPVNGYVVSPFGAKINRVMNKGIDIRSQEGAAVRASRAGKVVFCDPHMKGFGNTVIIDHGNGYQTVYSYNSQITVGVGDMVEQNSVIATAGRTGRAREPMVHFEIRKDGIPRDPEAYLPGKL